MSIFTDGLAWALMLTGTLFFATGALGLLRFADIYSRLHAVTKTDTLGLGLLATGLAIKSGSLSTALVLLVVWLLVLISGAVSCQLLARYSLDTETAAPANRPGGDQHHES